MEVRTILASASVEYLSQSVVARRLGTTRHRVRDLVAAVGIEPGIARGQWVFTPEQFERIARAHLATPQYPRGNPNWSGRPNANAR